MSSERVTAIADIITEKVTSIHEFTSTKSGKWSPLAGQYLVYGLERYFGFTSAVELERLVEIAWKNKEEIRPVIVKYLETILSERPKRG